MGTKIKKRIGRPREFDTETVLDRAVEVFFRKGYQATTLDDLTKAMEIERPSLYYAFGNKESLYLQALQRYREKYKLGTASILEENVDTKNIMENLLTDLIERQLKDKNSPGCMVVNATVDCQENMAHLRETVKSLHKENEEMLFELFKKGIEKGDLPVEKDPLSLAQFFNGIIQGMAVIARGQGSREALENIVKESLRILD